MSDAPTIAAMAAGVYGLRLLGLVVPLDGVPAFWLRALRALPVALLAALVASSKAGAAGGEPGRIAALAVGGAVVWFSRRMWAAIASGLAVYWLFRLIGWGA
jgi:branched-subunit amino acid transport protein